MKTDVNGAGGIGAVKAQQRGSVTIFGKGFLTPGHDTRSKAEQNFSQQFEVCGLSLRNANKRQKTASKKSELKKRI